MSGYRGAHFETVQIASSETESEPIHLRDRIMVGVITPAALTSTAIKFQAAAQQTGTYRPVYAGDTEVSITVATNEARAVALAGEDADALSAWSWIKLVTGSAEAADRDFILVLK